MINFNYINYIFDEWHLTYYDFKLFYQMVQHESSDFLFDRRIKKMEDRKNVHHCDTPICEFFCHFFIWYVDQRKNNIKSKKPIRFISQIMLLAYRDSGHIDSTGSTSYGSFSSKNYECVGNETSIHDCPNNDKQCSTTSIAKFRQRTELRCKRKTYWIHNNIYNCTFLLLVINATSNTDQIQI